jgi:hypothetical protein
VSVTRKPRKAQPAVQMYALAPMQKPNLANQLCVLGRPPSWFTIAYSETDGDTLPDF